MDYSQTRRSNKPPTQPWISVYLIISASLFFTACTHQPPSTSKTKIVPPAISPYTITLTSSGFEPNQLTIKIGQTVTWTNQSGIDATVDSSPHPIHTDYPPLNLGVIKNNSSASLTFTTAGTYKFHDHLNAKHYGSITVE